MKLTGYIRPDGRVGFRNYTVILPLVGCLSDIARRISSSDSNSVPLIHPNGCELVDFDADWMALQMERLVTHPNVRSVLFLTMGCASTNTYRLSQKAASKGKLVESINFHATGGTHKTVEKGVQLIQKMTKKSEKEKKECGVCREKEKGKTENKPCGKEWVHACKKRSTPSPKTSLPSFKQ